MTVRIEAGKIEDIAGSIYRRRITIIDCLGSKFSRCMVSDKREELEIIDHENFMKERIMLILNNNEIEICINALEAIIGEWGGLDENEQKLYDKMKE